VAAHTVADLDRRLGQIDSAIEEAAKRGKTNTALSAMEAQRRVRVSLVDERNREAGTLGSPESGTRECGRQGPADRDRGRTHPVCRRALIGADTDSKRAIRWLIALMVLCCDPLAIA
jgi:hypothetical protein